MWECCTIWKAGIWISEFIKVRIKKRNERPWTLIWIVTKKSSNKLDGIFGGPMSKHFLPRERFDLWESVFSIIGIHCKNLFAGWSAKNFDDFDKLINATFTRENWLAKHEFSDYATNGPNIDVCTVARVTKYQFRSAIVPRADI